MLSYSQAKELIAEHEKIEAELAELIETKVKICEEIEDKKAHLKAIEAEFLPEKKEEKASQKAEFMKAVVVNDGPKEEFIAAPAKAPKEEFIAAPAKAPKEELKASPYRIKGDR